MLFKNSNGKTYKVISKTGDYALLQDINSLQIVVTWVLMESSWCQGYYFDKDQKGSAIELYLKKSHKFEAPSFLNYQKQLLMELFLNTAA